MGYIPGASRHYPGIDFFAVATNYTVTADKNYRLFSAVTRQLACLGSGKKMYAGRPIISGCKLGSQCRDHTDFNVYVFGKGFYGNRFTGGIPVGKVFPVNIIYRIKKIHIAQKNGGFYHMIKTNT